MKINDEVYGRHEIKESVLINLINSNAVQRLKGVSQFGMPDEYYHKKGYSRYGHSMGVLVLLRRLNANLDEQVAGLLHDVSHTAFSHVIDWVLGDPTKEDYQDNNHLDVINNSDLPTILEKQGFDYKKISDLENFSLLEREAPGLCADRIDYTLREIEDSELVKKIIFDLRNLSGQLVFQNVGVAESFANEYSRMQKEHWAGNQARARYYILSRILKEGIEKKFISVDDFMKTDNEVIQLLKKSNDESILGKLNLLQTSLEIIECGEGVELKKKFRYIDPEVLVGRNVILLTRISFDYNSFLKKEKQNSNNYKKVKIKGFN